MTSQSQKKVLIIDSNIDQPWTNCADFRRYIDAYVVVRRAPQEDLPSSIRDFSHVIFSGSKTSILDSSPWVLRLMDFVRTGLDAGIPMLGVCYGHQIIARTVGGESVVRVSSTPEVGWVEITQTGRHPLLMDLPEKFVSFQSHYEEVCSLPDGFVSTAQSPRCGIQSYYLKEKPVFGVQFHPERNAPEGKCTLLAAKKKLSAKSDCIFEDSKAVSLFDENIAQSIFKKFLNLDRNSFGKKNSR